MRRGQLNDGLPLVQYNVVRDLRHAYIAITDSMYAQELYVGHSPYTNDHGLIFGVP